jgi:hypothetical protein
MVQLLATTIVVRNPNWAPIYLKLNVEQWKLAPDLLENQMQNAYDMMLPHVLRIASIYWAGVNIPTKPPVPVVAVISSLRMVSNARSRLL